jgi:sulfoxide reductase heme-binding subunit YedZ
MTPATTRGAPPENHATPASTPARHHPTTRPIKPPRWLPYVVFVAALLPLVLVASEFVVQLLTGTRYLGSNPIKAAEHFTGKWVLRFLILSLSVTPAIRLTRQGWLIRYRRTFGLFAFFYACVHLLIYFVLDVELNWADFVADIIKRKYITIGMTALLLMVPLVLTSTKASIKRLGNRRWNAIHRLVIATVVLGCIHYWMSVKRDITEPALFGILFAILLGYRFRRWRYERARRPAEGSSPVIRQPV